MPIRILSPDVAAQIAAGEVVERPASVVKELVENSIDAGATQVIVEIQGGGIDFIRVTDNGCGIPVHEVETAFQRHATSKLERVADLEAIATLGFRGEALPSIAAVARVSMSTRIADSPSGYAIELEGGRVLRQGAIGCPPGTSVTVRDLFANVPARRKFLKSPASEAGRIADLLSRLALAYPAVRFRLVVDDGRDALSTSGSGSVQDVLVALYGADVAGQLLPVVGESDGYRVEGFVSPPPLTRANRSYITLLVNHRWVQSRVLSYSLEQAYHGLLQQGRYPIAVVHLTVPYEQVDVNVHPTKREVRFRHEDRVFSAVQRAVRAALVARAPVPELPVETVAQTAQPAPALALSAPPYQPRLSATTQPSLTPKESLPRLRVLGQLGSTYIVAEGPDGLYLIDQHAAHERVVYERVRQAVEARAPEVQSLLEPAPVELAPEQAALVQEERELLERYGFLLEPFGERAYLLRGVPAACRVSDPPAALREVLDLMAREDRLKDVEERLAASIACHAAVRAGMEMASQAMEELVRQLEASASPNTCPHGRPTMIRVSSQHLERQFGRR